MKVIIHIGVHKTGTSALQAFLARNAPLLSGRGVYYRPTIPEWPNHNPMTVGFKPGYSSGPGLLAQQLAEADGKTLLISSEMLCEPDTDIEAFLACLSGHDVRTIAYIRHPCDIVISAFNEVVRTYESRWTRPINERPFAYNPPQIDLLGRWIERTEVMLAPYDPAQWVGGSLFTDFLSMIGVDGKCFDYRQENGNESLPYASAEELRILNATQISADQHREHVDRLRKLKRAAGPYPLTEQTIETCLTMMRETLPIYRPLFRPGFQEDFLLQPRPLAPGPERLSKQSDQPRIYTAFRQWLGRSGIAAVR